MSRRTQRRIGFLLVLLALTTAAAMAATAWNERAQGQRLAHWRQRLHSGGAAERFEAAQVVLELDPSDPRARLIAAQERVRHGQYGLARQLLGPLVQDSEQAEHPAAMELMAQSLLGEAAQRVAATTPMTLDVTARHLEELLLKAREAAAALRAIPGRQAAAPLLEARAVDLEATLVSLHHQKQVAELERARAITMDEHVESVSLQVAELRSRLEELDRQEQVLIQRALEQRPDDVRPQALLLNLHLRAGQFDLARQVAAQVAQRPALEPMLASELAERLLSLERVYVQEVRPEDVQLAAKLLQAAAVPAGTEATEPVPAPLLLAQVELALAQGQFPKARELAQQAVQLLPGHTRATFLLARARIGAGQLTEAVALLLPLNERFPSAEGLYLHALAAHTANQTALARALARQSLDLAANFLPARLLLIESLFGSGNVRQAEDEILAALQLSPEHSRVLSYQARWLVEQRQRRQIAEFLLQDRSPAGPLAAAIAAAMALDDVAAVRAAAASGASRVGGGGAPRLPLLASAWCEASPAARADAAEVVLLVMRDRLDDQPWRWPDPPPVRAIQRLSARRAARLLAAPQQDHLDTLRGSRSIPWPQEAALELVQTAQRHWPQDARLRALAAELRLWLGHERATEELAGGTEALAAPLPGDTVRRLIQALEADDRAAVDAALRHVLTHHPWAEPVLLLALRDALRRQDAARVESLLALAGQLNPRLAMLTGVRLALLAGQPDDVQQSVTLALRDEPADSMFRCLLSDVALSAALARDQPDLAIGTLESLATSVHGQGPALRLAAADVAIEWERPMVAVAILTALAADPGLPPRWLDAALARLAQVQPDERFQETLALLAEQRAGDPLVQLYWAQSHLQQRRLDQAAQVLARVLEREPQAPRALMLQAALVLEQGQPQRAREIYVQLREHGPAAAEAAERELQRLVETPREAAAAAGGQP